MTTNEHLVKLERDLEADLLEARRELELGRDEAIETLGNHRDTLGNRTEKAVEAIRTLAHEAEEDLKLVQSRLGELNYFLAEEEMNDLETFDRYRDRILGAMRTAKDDLSRVSSRGSEWGAHEKDLDDAWGMLSRRLESVRAHLLREAYSAEGEFDSERAQLSKRLEEIDGEEEQSDPDINVVTRLRTEFRQLLPGIKALFMHPDATVPKTQDEIVEH